MSKKRPIEKLKKIKVVTITIEGFSESCENIGLDYEKLKQDQISTRNKHNEKHNDKLQQRIVSDPLPGDVVTIADKQDKHKAKDQYVVTGKINEKVKMQKIIHPYEPQMTKLRSGIVTKFSFLQLI